MSFKGTGRGYWSGSGSTEKSADLNVNLLPDEINGDTTPTFYKLKLKLGVPNTTIRINEKFELLVLDGVFEVAPTDLPITSLEIVDVVGTNWTITGAYY